MNATSTTNQRLVSVLLVLLIILIALLVIGIAVSFLMMGGMMNGLMMGTHGMLTNQMSQACIDMMQSVTN